MSVIRSNGVALLRILPRNKLEFCKHPKNYFLSVENYR